MIENIIFAGCMLLLLFCMVMIVKVDVTQAQQLRVARAIFLYKDNLIDTVRWGEEEVDFGDMEPFDKTLLRLWDWGYKRILPADKMEIIKPYLKEGER